MRVENAKLLWEILVHCKHIQPNNIPYKSSIIKAKLLSKNISQEITIVRYKKYRQQDQLQAFNVRLALTSITRKRYHQKTISSQHTSLYTSMLKALTTLHWPQKC